jgi:hypothetical protein
MEFPKPTKQEKTRKPLKRSPIKRRSKNTFKHKKEKADRLFSLLIRKPGRCAVEGLDRIQCNGGHQCMHIITRGNFRLRWDTANGLEGCQAHHLFYTLHPWDWVELVRENFPDRYEYLNAVRNEPWDKDIDKVLEGLEGVE